MSDIIVDTSPIQYLHQIGQLSLLARLSGSIIVPPQAVKERVLLDAKLAGMVPAVAPLLDQLQSIQFRVDQKTRLAVLKMAGEIVPNG